MWNKQRRDEEAPKPFNPPKPATVAPSPVEFKEAKSPMSSMPIGRVDNDSYRSGGAATIGKAVKVVGQIISKEDLFVDGEVEGTVEALEHKLIIGPTGQVRAEVKAREVVALGAIQGNVEAVEKIEIRKDARLIGDIRTARIIIEDGAYFKGSIDIVKPEPVKGNNQNKQQSAPHSASATPVAAGEAKR
jgi:cytoskeletal protein CcmA (bactofilin family)